jgi:glucokinase
VILAGDIGGTKTRIAVFDDAVNLRTLAEERFPSGDYRSLDAVLQRFRQLHDLPVIAACFGVAGPVKDGRCEATNLPWIVDAAQLAAELGLPHVGLVNDLEANAYGLATLGSDDCRQLAAGEPGSHGNVGLIAAGTGLGEAGLFWDGRRLHPFACEGGHTDFSPRTALEVRLLEWLRTNFVEHVSWERVLSGPGLVNVYRFLREDARAEEPAWLTEQMHTGDPAAAISQAALAHTSPLCVHALDLFVSLYGAEAGNLALKLMATGGMYIGGGIAPRIAAKLGDGTFMRAFVAKGRMAPLLEAMPVRVVMNDRTALRGAARHAADGALTRTPPAAPAAPGTSRP